MAQWQCWQREGQVLQARYLGVQVKGLVVESRVKYGGRVQHKLAVLEPYVFLGETREGGVALVEEEQVEQVLVEFEVVEIENITTKQD